MNILHLKYAVEVEKTASITKAAANLYMGQPHLSRCIKELEDSIGIKIFKRTAKGIIPTVDGTMFLEEAKNILIRIENLELAYSADDNKKINVSVSVPRSQYISKAFAKTVARFKDEKEILVNYKETNTTRAIENILQGNYKLAIIRITKDIYPYVVSTLDSRELKHEILAECKAYLVASAYSVFGNVVEDSELEKGIEICFGDPYVPNASGNSIKKSSDASDVAKKIMVYERASIKNLLQAIPNSYMWVVDIEKNTKEMGDIRFLQTKSNITKQYIDVLVSTKTYRFSEVDLDFISNVKRTLTVQ